MHDPYYFECGAGWPDVDHCRYSDAAVVRYYPGVNYDFGRIYRTLARAYGPNGVPGIDARTIDDANPYITITAKGSWPVEGSTVDKIGRTTGWTYGTVDRTCEDNEYGDVNRLCGGRAHYRSDPGDSGSPVFLLTGWQPGTATLIGISWGGLGGDSDIGYFSSMWALEYELGTLDVTTDPPPPPPPPPPEPLTASISGPQNPPPSDGMCNWMGLASGGAGGYTFQWSGTHSGSGQMVWGSPGQSGWLYLLVTDGAGAQATAEFLIGVDPGAPPCEG